ncbi:UNC93 2 protein [Rutstroemia sp. NJR-2017a WRK4]|nr:UNC93 2 protein [Rutstroemia sp. NJR-2017a WRK4]
MSQLDAAPPDTTAGGKADALRPNSTFPLNPGQVEFNDQVDMEEYTRTVPWWKRVHRHSLTQMLLLSIQATCGPAMSDAISVCFFGGPLVNKIGVKWALVVGAASFPIQGSAYYCNSKFGNQWYLILSGALSGIGTGCWYIAEAGSIMSLSPSGARGKYLALWIVSRNLGQLIGGAINLAKNSKVGSSGGITPSTYVAFLIIECFAPKVLTALLLRLPFAFLITPLEHVVRSDGTRIVVSERLSTKQEFKLIKVTWTSSVVVLSSLWAFWSFFYSIGCFGLGFILDMKDVSQRRRAQLGLFTVVILNLGVYIWSIIMQVRFNHHNPGTIDWNDSLYPTAFLPYFFVQTTGPLSQSYMYWLISSFATDAQSNVRNGAAFRCIEAIGQAIAYSMNTNINTNTLVGFIITFALMTVAVGPMIALTSKTPDKIPADIVAEEQGMEIENIYIQK